MQVSTCHKQELVGHLSIELSFLLSKFLPHEACSLEFLQKQGFWRMNLSTQAAVQVSQTTTKWYLSYIMN